MSKKRAIKLNPEHKGKLHRALGIPSDKRIPLAKEEKAKHSGNPETRKEANFAINFHKVKKTGRKSPRR